MKNISAFLMALAEVYLFGSLDFEGVLVLGGGGRNHSSSPTNSWVPRMQSYKNINFTLFYNIPYSISLIS